MNHRQTSRRLGEFLRLINTISAAEAPNRPDAQGQVIRGLCHIIHDCLRISV